MEKQINIIGKKFGKLTVIKEIDKDKNYHKKYLCICDCGNYTEVLDTSLIGKKTKSCGCIQKDIALKNIGKKYNKLTIIDVVKEDKKTVKYKCQCECGNTIISLLQPLINGKTKSCGCYKKSTDKEKGKKRIDNNVFLMLEDTHITRIKNKKPQKNNKLKIKGVCYTKSMGLYSAYITFKHHKYQKRFLNLEDAIKQRKEWEEEFFNPIIEKYSK